MEASVRAAGATRLGSAAPLSQPFHLSLHHLHTAFGDVSPRNVMVLRLCENTFEKDETCCPSRALMSRDAAY